MYSCRTTAVSSETCRKESIVVATYSVLGLNERVIDSNDLDIVVLNGIAEDNATDTAETVDADLDNHFVCGRE
jgi:hypothetical protein